MCVYFSALLPTILLRTHTMCYELMSLNAFKYCSILFSSFIFVDFVFVSIFFYSSPHLALFLSVLLSIFHVWPLFLCIRVYNWLPNIRLRFPKKMFLFSLLQHLLMHIMSLQIYTVTLTHSHTFRPKNSAMRASLRPTTWKRVFTTATVWVVIIIKRQMCRCAFCALYILHLWLLLCTLPFFWHFLSLALECGAE